MASLWRWKYANPWSWPGEGPTVLLAFIDKKLVGSIAYMRIPLQLGRRETTAAGWLMDNITHPGYRKHLYGSSLRLMCALPSVPGIGLAAGVPATIRRVLAKRLHTKELREHEFWGWVLRKQEERAEEPLPARNGFQLSEVGRFPEEITALYEKIAKGYGVLVRRDAQYLNWRYVDVPFAPNPYLKFVVRKAGRARGVLVLRRSSRNRRVGIIKELFLGRRDKRLREFALRCAKKIFRARGVRQVKILFSNKETGLKKSLLQEGFLPLFSSPGFCYYLPAARKLSAGKAFKKGFHLSGGDSDLGLLLE